MRLLLALLLLFLPATARADDIAAAGRGVVRVVTIAIVDGRVVGFGHGSGVAVGPDRIITNAHVVELAQRYPEDVVIGVVPSEGAKGFQGRLVAYDAQADLALISFAGAKLPPATFYTGSMGEGDPVVALGYPGNVDLATARSAADYITPTTPVRSEGVLSGRRALSGVEVLLHTASIARGNSGGPLLDRCGRVIGINSAITRGAVKSILLATFRMSVLELGIMEATWKGRWRNRFRKIALMEKPDGKGGHCSRPNRSCRAYGCVEPAPSE